MDDTELQAIRAARLQEMQRNAQGRSTDGGSTGNDEKNAQQEKANNYADSVLNQILEPEAKQRLSRVRMVKPERVLGVENYLIRLYQSGGIRSKVGEEDIVDILDKIANEERKNTTTRIKFERREYTDNNNTTSKSKNVNNNSDSDDDFFDE
ncbi:hypothetical protein C6P40_003303 [Pichia californica]|uniref:Programmed cell death protein 5 n=1 Tax=Pichia californica TaxID=460514 RepID=A0A9P6WND3_9ASCO|nr:hypothetical protein C6P42_000919 [[Candida] californica]KAG0690282.1 hypothetical protein C6P40_003303 [[Candida] californica]